MNVRSLALRAAHIALTTLGLGSGCRRTGTTAYQGYLDGEFVYLALPLAGRLEKLSVKKGAQVTAGAELFTLEQGAEIARTCGRCCSSSPWP